MSAATSDGFYAAAGDPHGSGDIRPRISGSLGLSGGTRGHDVPVVWHGQGRVAARRLLHEVHQLAGATLTAAIRRWLVIRLVRWSARGWDASYAAYVRCDRDGVPWWWRDFWTWVACRIEHVAIPLARRLNTADNCMGAEMAEHGWWG